MYKATMSQKIVKKKAAYPVELTEMQRRFCEYLLFKEGRTTGTDAAIAAGYAEKSAAVEASRLKQNPAIQRYLQKRTNEINRGLTLTRDNYIRRQMRLSDKVEKDEKASKTVGHETLIGKAGGLLNGYISESSNQIDIAERMKRINELKEIQKDRLKNLIIDGESQDINEF